MAFNQQSVKNSFTGAKTAYAAPLAAYSGSQVLLSGVTAGSVVSSAGLVIPCAGPQWNIEWDSLVALVQTSLTTATVTATTRWEVSEDGVNFVPLLGLNAPGNVTVAAAGTGGLVTTNYAQACSGYDPSFPYMRLAVLVGVVTGAAGDTAVVSYNFRRRWIGA